jgi:hypothetical protein
LLGVLDFTCILRVILEAEKGWVNTFNQNGTNRMAQAGEKKWDGNPVYKTSESAREK